MTSNLPPSDNVIPLFGRDDHSSTANPVGPDETVVATLSRLLEFALAGELVSLSAVALTRENKFLYTFCGRGSYATTIGGIEELKFQIMQSHQQQTPSIPVS